MVRVSVSLHDDLRVYVYSQFYIIQTCLNCEFIFLVIKMVSSNFDITLAQGQGPPGL